MKAKKVVITAKGGPEVIQVIEFDIAEPADNEVGIRVKYAGVAYGDLMVRKIAMPGLPRLPMTPGADITGIIDKIGKNITGFKPGDRVAVPLMSAFGGQAQYVCVDADQVLKVPETVPLDKAVCLIINYLTAYGMFTRYITQEKCDKPVILVHGGSGGVGSALIQIAVSQGIKVYSTASKTNLDMIQKMGAIGIDYQNTDFVDVIKNDGPGKVDGVFDPIGKDYLKRSLRALKKGGSYIGYGFQKDLNAGFPGVLKSMLRFFARKMITFNKKLFFHILNEVEPKDQLTNLETLFTLYTEGKIDPIISEVFAIDDAVKAHYNLEVGKRRGKILITPFIGE